MGLFNLLSPVFSAVDAVAAPILPLAIRIALWAILLAVITLALYKGLSPQARIGRAKREAREARQALNRFDGEFADAGPLIKRQFATALRHIALVVPGTVISILPLLCFLVWADNHLAQRLPIADASLPALRWMPPDPASGWQARWQPQDDQGLAIDILDPHASQRTYRLVAPVSVIAHHSAWNWLVGNPLGYLPPDAPADALVFDLPRRDVLHFGPTWLRGWLGVFLPVMFVVSLLMFRIAKIE